ncbi:MAG: hypothetical protein ACLQBX_18550 [Candidatus Limnocylindrales bacterium]
MTGAVRRPATDAVLASGIWVVGERYVVHDGIDRLGQDDVTWQPLQGRPEWPVHQRDGRLVWIERDQAGDWRTIPDEDRRPRVDTTGAPLETRVRVIVDESPDPRTRAPTVWAPSERVGLADELVALGNQGDAAIVRWVEAHGFVGVRANPHERQESIEEISWALRRLARTRDLMHAIRERTGDALRAEAERILGFPEGTFAEVNRDDPADTFPLHPGVLVEPGLRLARAFGIAVPAGQHWTGAGAYIQALYALTEELQAPLQHLLRVQAGIMPTEDGMRLQGAIVAPGPLATAYLQTLDEASWPAITYVGDLPRIDWRAPRRCQRCGTTFKPRRLDQKWCSKRCLWAASKARTAHPGPSRGTHPSAGGRVGTV